MKELFFMGGTLFMSILTVMLFIIIIGYVFLIVTRNSKTKEANIERFKLVKYAGVIALTVGILGQFLGLHQAFSYLGEVGSVEPQIMYNGLKVSMITTMYGLIIFIISTLCYTTGRYLADRKV